MPEGAKILIPRWIQLVGLSLLLLFLWVVAGAVKHVLVKKIRKHDVGKYTHKIVTFFEGAAISAGKLVFDLVLILVISIYMLLGMPKLAASLDRRFPSRPGSDPLLVRMSKAVVSYV